MFYIAGHLNGSKTIAKWSQTKSEFYYPTGDFSHPSDEGRSTDVPSLSNIKTDDDQVLFAGQRGCILLFERKKKEVIYRYGQSV